MAHFYSAAHGARGEATRLGSAGSGVTTTAASWQGSVSVELSQRGEVDWAEVWLRPWYGKGERRLIYDGPVGGANVQHGEHSVRVPEGANLSPGEREVA